VSLSAFLEHSHSRMAGYYLPFLFLPGIYKPRFKFLRPLKLIENQGFAAITNPGVRASKVTDVLLLWIMRQQRLRI